MLFVTKIRNYSISNGLDAQTRNENGNVDLENEKKLICIMMSYIGNKFEFIYINNAQILILISNFLFFLFIDFFCIFNLFSERILL